MVEQNERTTDGFRFGNTEVAQNSISYTFFSGKNFFMSITCRLKEDCRKKYGPVLYYNPRKAFRITTDKEKADFLLDDIYEFEDMLNLVYKALEKPEMFYIDGDKLVLNKDLAKKYVYNMEGPFGSLLIYPAVVKTWNRKSEEYQITEGVVLRVNNDPVTLSHKELKKVLKIIERTDWLTLAETIRINNEEA